MAFDFAQAERSGSVGASPPFTPEAVRPMTSHMNANDDLKALIRTIPDFPKPGIQFRDITTLLLDPSGVARTVERMVTATRGPVDLVAGIEARGFLFAAALAVPLNAGVLLIRKDGKLVPCSWDEALDYTADRLKAIKSESGGDAVAFLASAKVTNEENYILQKFARSVIGTNNIDHCARL